MCTGFKNTYARLSGGARAWMFGLAILGMLVSLGVHTSTAGASQGTARWIITSTASPARFAAGSKGDEYVVTATNVGATATGGTVTIEDVLPVGMQETGISGEGEGVGLGEAFESGSLSCGSTPVAERTYSCTYGGAVAPGDTLRVAIEVEASGPFSEAEPLNDATVEGGGAEGGSPTVSEPTAIGGSPLTSGISSFFTAASSAVAGAHPNLTTSFSLNVGANNFKGFAFPAQTAEPVAPQRDIQVDLPPGLVGNPNPAATLRCSSLHKVIKSECPEDTAVGVATAVISGARYVELVYSIVPYANEPAAFAFELANGIAVIRLDTSVRSNGDYGIHVSIPEVNEDEPVVSSTVTLWGVPAENNGAGPYRTSEVDPVTQAPITFGGPGEQANVATPFLTSPSQCGVQLGSSIATDSWAEPGPLTPGGTAQLSDPRWRTASSSLPGPGASQGFEDCGLLAPLFTPALKVTPTQGATQAGAPAEYAIGLKVPQNESPDGFATPDLRQADITLPRGTVITPSAAEGLQACSEAQVELHSSEPLKPAACPSASKIGSVEVGTPLLEEPLRGSLYLAQQGNDGAARGSNPFGTLLAVYLVAEGSGVIVKRAGEVKADPVTGQLTTSFRENPQLPFSDLRVRLNGGPQAPLANPRTCGLATSTAQLIPWSASLAEPDTVESASGFEVTGCEAPSFKPAFSAGMTDNALAGAYSHFSVNFGRTDGDQFLNGISVNTPPGLLGAVSHVPRCPEPQASRGTCASTSQIGVASVLAGVGPLPLHVSGVQVFLTGPYGGAPFGLSIVVPLIAGPFNLGNEVVRAAIYIDPHTAALTIVSAPIPSIKEGIPFQIRDVQVDVTRNEFILNATDCNPMAIGSTITSLEGARAGGSSPYQAVNCAKLPFKPKFSASTSGKTSKANGASLSVKLVAPHEGPQSTGGSGTSSPSSLAGSSAGTEEANIRSVKVDLPKQLPSRLTTLQKACTAAQFDSNPAGCPSASIVGHAKASTPILPVPLEGPAYFVSHGNEAFPQLILVLQGYGITIDLVGDTFISKAGITSSTFKTVPDAPVGSFELNLPEGKYSALVANGNLCHETKTVTRKKKVDKRVHGKLVRRHGKIVKVTKKVKKTEPEPLIMPTSITGQNGVVLKQSTPISVTGCSKAKHAKKSHKVKPKKKRKGRKG